MLAGRTAWPVKILIVAGLVVMVIAGLGSAVYLSAVESATVSITLPAWQLSSFTVLRGAPSGGDFRTQRAQITLTDSTTGIATGSVISGGTYATGYVVFNGHCIPANVFCTFTPSPPGAFVCAVNPGRTAPCYSLLSTVTCFCGEKVPVRAQGVGAWYNVPRNSIYLLSWNPDTTNGFAAPYNPQPIAGGTDPSPSPAVTQSDIDAAYASARAQLSIDLQSALLVKGGGLIHVIPDRAPQMTVTSNVAAGARTNTFQVTATGTLGATEFQDSDALALIAKGIDRWVPSGYRLNGAPVVTQYKIESHTETGEVTVSGEALDSVLPKFSIDTLRSRLRGVSVDAARAMIETVAPVSLVEINLRPAAAPILPLDASRIVIVVTIRPAPTP